MTQRSQPRKEELDQETSWASWFTVKANTIQILPPTPPPPPPPLQRSGCGVAVETMETCTRGQTYT